MTNPLYVGIENEFQLMKGLSYEAFGGYFRQCLSEYPHPYYEKGPAAIRTRIGSAIYADGHEPEVCTPPVLVRPGAATETAALQYLARRELFEFLKPFPELSLIGYSTHWNIGGHPHLERSSFMQHFDVLFALFGLTPLSIGINLRNKEPRWELLTDFIPGEDQNQAMLSLLMAARVGYEYARQYAPFLHRQAANGMCPNPTPDGRHSLIPVIFQDNTPRQVYAQDYLEIYYELLGPALQACSTREEIKNLEDFVSGKKALEIDQFRKYAYVSFFKDDGHLSFDQRLALSRNAFQEDRPLHSESAACYGVYATQHIEHSRPVEIISLEWDQAEIRDKNGNDTKLEGIEDIILFGRTLQSKRYPTFAQDYLELSTLLRYGNREVLAKALSEGTLGNQVESTNFMIPELKKHRLVKENKGEITVTPKGQQFGRILLYPVPPQSITATEAPDL